MKLKIVHHSHLLQSKSNLFFNWSDNVIEYNLQLLKHLNPKVIKISRDGNSDTLYINKTVSRLGRLLDDAFEIENCSTTSAIINGYLNDTDYKNALQLLRKLKLKIKLQKNVISGNTLIINDTSAVLGRFLDDGIEIENCSLITSATISEDLNNRNFPYALKLLRLWSLKIKNVSKTGLSLKRSLDDDRFQN